MERVTMTGITALDEILNGGLCTGNIALVEGGSGAGKTTLAVEFIVNGAVKFKEPGIIVVLEEHLGKLREDMLKFGWDLESLEKDKKIRLFGLSAHSFVEMVKKEESPLLRAVRQIGAKRICVDSLTLLVEEVTTAKQRRQLFSTLINALRREGLTAMLVIELPSTMYDDQYVMERSVVDSVFRLSTELSPVGQGQIFRRFEVVKSRGQSFNEGQHALKIGYSSIFESRGVHIFPRFKSMVGLTECSPKKPERVGFGIPDLDAILNGGVYAGSATMIAGPSGVGKSLLGLQFIIEGMKRGERCMIVSMEESIPQILTNAKTLGMDLSRFLSDGILTAKITSPLELDIDEHIYELTRLVEQKRIDRLLIDSVSTYEIAMRADPEHYKDYIYALLTYFKSRFVTTVVTSEIPDLAGSPYVTSHGTSFIVDNIFVLRYVPMRGELRKLMYVLKSRGSKHQECFTEYTIGEKGIRLSKIDPQEAGIIFSVSGFDSNMQSMG